MVSLKSFLVALLKAEGESIAITGVELGTNIASLVTGEEVAEEVGPLGGTTWTLRAYINAMLRGDFARAGEAYKEQALETGVLGQRLVTGFGLMLGGRLLQKSSLLRGKSNIEKLVDMVVS